MSKRIKALVSPDLLIWARESAAFSTSEAAHKMNITIEKIETWESGRSGPTIKQLRKLGHIYKRPIAVFYLPERPTDFKPIRDFRRTATAEEFEHSSKLNIEIRNATFRRESAIELFNDLYDAIPAFQHKIKISDDPEQSGVLIRKLLRINYNDQSQWTYGYGALKKWRSAIEDTGVLVFQSFGIDVEEMRGFSISESPLPAIVLNSKDTPAGRIFTLIHEFVHILLKESGICDLHDDYNDKGQQIEIFCNHVAGATLITKEELLRQDVVIKKNIQRDWDDDDLKILSKHFNVSKEVVVRRLLINNLTSQSFYLHKRNDFLGEYKKLQQRKPDGFVPPHTKAISCAGTTFVRLVLDAYHQQKITSSDVSDYLQVKLNHLRKIESEMKL